MTQTVAEPHTAEGGPSTVRGWTKHGGVWVTDVRADDDTIAAFVAHGLPDPDAALSAFRAHGDTLGLDLDGEVPPDQRQMRSAWARRIPVQGGDPPVYADLAAGWRLQLDACPLDGDAFEVTVLEPGPPSTNPQKESPA